MQTRIMVCVTMQRACKRLIEIGKKVSEKMDGELFVVHVVRTGANFLGNPDEGEALEYLHEISKKANATMSVLRSDDVVQTLVDFANEYEANMIIAGESPEGKDKHNIIKQLERRLPGVEMNIVSS